MRPGRWLALWISCWLCLPLPAHAAGIDHASQLHAFMKAAAGTLPKTQQDTLIAIDSQERRHLAMTYYLRAGSTIAARWSWTAKEINAYQLTSEYTAAIAEIEKISVRFAEDNPGYVLHINTEIRSLEKQIERWQEVRSIGTASAQLQKAALNELTNRAYAAEPDEKSLQRFTKFLTTWRASPPPTLAAPGMSLHGRGRAYDFQIYNSKGRPIATTESATVKGVWDGQGWTKKLADAVHAASNDFVGPLQAPREPWHYEYRPKQQSR